MPSLPLPARGLTKDEVLRRMRALKAHDARWREGKTFSLVYFASDEVSELVKDAYGEFMSENALSPMAFPSLQQLEAEVLAMCGPLFHGGAEVCGTMTSG